MPVELGDHFNSNRFIINYLGVNPSSSGNEKYFRFLVLGLDFGTKICLLLVWVYFVPFNSLIKIHFSSVIIFI